MKKFEERDACKVNLAKYFVSTMTSKRSLPIKLLIIEVKPAETGIRLNIFKKKLGTNRSRNAELKHGEKKVFIQQAFSKIYIADS